MSSPRLRTRIAAAALSPPVARTFAEGLEQFVSPAPDPAETQQRLIARLMGSVPPDGTPSAPLDALWPHRELFLTGCIYVAVAEGRYGVEAARQVSVFAHRLGFSAHGLERLEAKVFAELQSRSERRSVRDCPTGRGEPVRGRRTARAD